MKNRVGEMKAEGIVRLQRAIISGNGAIDGSNISIIMTRNL